MKKELLILPIVLLFIGCSSDLEESMEITNECIEDKFDDEKSKYESIDEALTAYDFESARVLLGCYEDACFNAREGSRMYCDSPPENMESAKSKADENPYYKNLLKIVSSEVAYFFKVGEYNRAKSIALEAKMFFVYNEEIPNLINNLIDKNNMDEAVSILSKYSFSYAIEKNNGYDNNRNYNDEANRFNDMVNSLFNDALFDENKSVLKKCLLLYVPIVENDGTYYFKDKKIVNSYKKTARNKLKEAGIRL
ncbi:MAG: hypothetical protein VX756_04880 [Bacteroidota bacterium]|nr:hypothetical protein [Bacteroidota bacterium]